MRKTSHEPDFCFVLASPGHSCGLKLGALSLQAQTSRMTRNLQQVERLAPAGRPAEVNTAETLV
jgi:hypothetical protein